MQLRKLQTYVDYWEERAEKVLSHFNYEYPDEIDIYDICWRYGVKILPLDAPFVEGVVDFQSIKHLKAFSIPKETGRRGTIFLKEGLGTIEKKLLLAEEFCHIYSHHSSQLSIDKYSVKKTEKQAKKMVAYLLMPNRFLCDVYEVAFNEAVLISDIADHFVVTEEFAHFRLELIFNRKVDAMYALKGKLGTLEWFN